jgi:N,N'-diacetylchitobiose non-reducing end deacetylase
MPDDRDFPQPDIFEARTVLAIQPHYDDNDLGTGGTLAALSRAGARVIYLTVTDDQVGVLDPYLSQDEMETALRQEQAAAGQHIQVAEQRHLGYPDAGPIDYYALRNDLIREIRSLHPDVIFTVDPWLPYEFHQDHILTGRAVTEAIGLYVFPRLEVDGEKHLDYRPHPIQAIAYYFSHAPNTFVDITATRQVKAQAVRCYQLQFSPDEMEQLLLQIEADEREAALGHGCDFAEPLKVLRPAQMHIRTDTWKR